MDISHRLVMHTGPDLEKWKDVFKRNDIRDGRTVWEGLGAFRRRGPDDSYEQPPAQRKESIGRKRSRVTRCNYSMPL